MPDTAKTDKKKFKELDEKTVKDILNTLGATSDDISNLIDNKKHYDNLEIDINDIIAKLDTCTEGLSILTQKVALVSENLTDFTTCRFSKEECKQLALDTPFLGLQAVAANAKKIAEHKHNLMYAGLEKDGFKDLMAKSEDSVDDHLQIARDISDNHHAFAFVFREKGQVKDLVMGGDVRSFNSIKANTILLYKNQNAVKTFYDQSDFPKLVRENSVVKLREKVENLDIARKAYLPLIYVGECEDIYKAIIADDAQEVDRALKITENAKRIYENNDAYDYIGLKDFGSLERWTAEHKRIEANAKYMHENADAFKAMRLNQNSLRALATREGAEVRDLKNLIGDKPKPEDIQPEGKSVGTVDDVEAGRGQKR